MSKRIILSLLFFGFLMNIHSQNSFTINDNYYEFIFDIEEYGLTQVEIIDIWNYFPLNNLFWNVNAYRNKYFILYTFNYDWFTVKRFIIKEKEILLDNGIKIGNNYNEIIKNYSQIYVINRDPFGQYIPIDLNSTNYQFNYKVLVYGKKYMGYPYLYEFYDMELFFNDNDELIEIHINIANININININDLINNVWMTAPTSNLPHVLNIINDGTFMINYKFNVRDEEEHNKYYGMWQLIYNNGIPKIKLVFTNIPDLNGEYDINRIAENEYCIRLYQQNERLFVNMWFFYPFFNMFPWL